MSSLVGSAKPYVPADGSAHATLEQKSVDRLITTPPPMATTPDALQSLLVHLLVVPEGRHQSSAVYAPHAF